MNKKIITYSLIFSFLFAGITYVSADEDSIEPTSDIAPTPTSFQKNTEGRYRPEHLKERTEGRYKPKQLEKELEKEIQRKNNLRERYRQKLDSLKKNLKERPEKIENERKNIRERRDYRREVRKGVATSTKRIKNERRSYNEKRDSVREKIKEQRKLIKERLRGQRKDRVKNRINIISKNFERTIERINTLENKIEERIKKMQEELGYNMTKPKSLIEETRSKIINAREEIKIMTIALEEILESENPANSYAKAREITKSAREKIREAHRSLVDVVKSIRASVKLPKTTKDIGSIEDNTTTE